MKNEWHDWNLCFVLHLRLVWCMLSRRKQLVSVAFFTPPCVVSWSSVMSIYMWTETLLLSSLTATRTKHLSAGQSNSAAIIHSLLGKVPAYDVFCRGVRIWAMFRKDSSRSYLKLAVEYRCIYSLKARSSACWCVPLSFICTLTHLCSLGGRWWALLGFKCPWGNLTPICFKELLIILFVINMKLGE